MSSKDSTAVPAKRPSGQAVATPSSKRNKPSNGNEDVEPHSTTAAEVATTEPEPRDFGFCCAVCKCLPGNRRSFVINPIGGGAFHRNCCHGLRLHNHAPRGWKSPIDTVLGRSRLAESRTNNNCGAHMEKLSSEQIRDYVDLKDKEEKEKEERESERGELDRAMSNKRGSGRRPYWEVGELSCDSVWLFRLPLINRNDSVVATNRLCSFLTYTLSSIDYNCPFISTPEPVHQPNPCLLHSQCANDFLAVLFQRQKKNGGAMEGAVVMILFDGIGGGLVALKRAGIALKKVILVGMDIVGEHIARHNHDNSYNPVLGNNTESIEFVSIPSFEELHDEISGRSVGTEHNWLHEIGGEYF